MYGNLEELAIVKQIDQSVISFLCIRSKFKNKLLYSIKIVHECGRINSVIVIKISWKVYVVECLNFHPCLSDKKEL